MRNSIAAAATLTCLCVTLATPVLASRILVPLHKQGGVVIVDDRNKIPNITFHGIPGVHGLASDGKFLGVAITDGTGNSPQPEIVLLDVRQPTPLASIKIPAASGHVAVSPNSRFAAVVRPDLRSVSVVDLRYRKPVSTLSIDGVPKDVVFSRDSRQLFVSDSDSGKPLRCINVSAKIR